MLAFDAKLGEIRGAAPWTDGLKGAAIVREYPDRAWIASIYWHRNGYPYQLVVALAPTRSFSNMIAARDLIAWIDETGARDGNQLVREQVFDTTRLDWPSLGFRTAEDAIEFLQRIREARLGGGYRAGILYPKRLDGPVSSTLMPPSDDEAPNLTPLQLQAESAEQSQQALVPNPYKFRAAESSNADSHKSIVASMFHPDALPKIRMQAALMELLGRPDVEDVRKIRIGQGLLRRNLMQLHGMRCQVTGIRVRELLRCSHIKPWALCSKREQLDLDNCLLLSAHWDAAFDGGLISFESDGSLVLGPALRASPSDVKVLFGEYDRLCAIPSSRQAQYLAWHRSEVLR